MRIEEAKKEVEYGIKISEMKLEKLKKFYREELSNESFALSKI